MKTATRPTTEPYSGSTATTPIHTLDSLARLSVEALADVYRNGTVPSSLLALEGSPDSRMLTVVGPPGRWPLAGLIRRFSASRTFPWRGKTFRGGEAGTGEGINRLRLGLSWKAFPFETRVEPSAIDGSPCVLLDYDRPGNPWFIRLVRDELREVSPGLFLGPAMIVVRGTPRLMLFFAVSPVS